MSVKELFGSDSEESTEEPPPPLRDKKDDGDKIIKATIKFNCHRAFSKEMDEDDISRVIEAYADAAWRSCFRRAVADAQRGRWLARVRARARAAGRRGRGRSGA